MGGQIFWDVLLGFMLILTLKFLRRELKVRPWFKVAFRWMCLMICFGFISQGLREIQSGRWTGLTWLLIGLIVVYLGGGRERIQEAMKKRAEEDQRRE